MAGTQALRPVGHVLNLGAVSQGYRDTWTARVGADILRVRRMNGDAPPDDGNRANERDRVTRATAGWMLSTIPLFRADDAAVLTDFSARDVAGVLQVAQTTRRGRVVELALLTVHRDRLLPILVEGDVVAAPAEETTLAGQNAELLYFVPPTGAGQKVGAREATETVYTAHPLSLPRDPAATSAIVRDSGPREVASAGRVDTIVVHVASAAGNVVLRAPAVASSATESGAVVYAAKAVVMRTHFAVNAGSLLRAFAPSTNDAAVRNAQDRPAVVAMLVPLETETTGVSPGVGFAFGGRGDRVVANVGPRWPEQVHAASPAAVRAAARLLQYPIGAMVLGVHVATSPVGRSPVSANEERAHEQRLGEARAVVHAYYGFVVERVHELDALGVGRGVGPWLGLYSVVGGAAAGGGEQAMAVESRAASTTAADVVVAEVAVAEGEVAIEAAPGTTLVVGDGTTNVESVVAVVAHEAAVTGTADGFVLEPTGDGGATATVTTAEGQTIEVAVPAGSALVGAGDGAVAVEAGGERVEVKLEPGVEATSGAMGGAVESGDGERAAVGDVVVVKTEEPQEEEEGRDVVAELLNSAEAGAAGLAGIPEAPPAPVFRPPRRAATQAEVRELLEEARRLARGGGEDADTLRLAVGVLADRIEDLEAQLRRRRRARR